LGVDKTDPGTVATALLLKLPRQKDLKKERGKSSELRRGLIDQSSRNLELCRNLEPGFFHGHIVVRDQKLKTLTTIAGQPATRRGRSENQRKPVGEVSELGYNFTFGTKSLPYLYHDLSEREE